MHTLPWSYNGYNRAKTGPKRGRKLLTKTVFLNQACWRACSVSLLTAGVKCSHETNSFHFLLWNRLLCLILHELLLNNENTGSTYFLVTERRCYQSGLCVVKIPSDYKRTYFMRIQFVYGYCKYHNNKCIQNQLMTIETIKSISILQCT